MNITNPFSIENSSLFSEMALNAYRSNVPFFTTIELSQDCNLRCSHCYNFDRTRDQEVHKRSGRSLSVNEWKKVISEIIDAGGFVICFTGGEVTLVSYLWELIDFVHSKNAMVKIKTNGTTFSQRFMSQIKKHRPDSIELSIYGMSEESYSKFTGRSGMFLKMSEGVENILKTDSILNINFILNRFNAHEVDEMISFANKFNLTFSFSDEITKRYDDTDSSLDFNLTDDQYFKLLNSKNAKYFKINHDLNNHRFQCSCAKSVCGVGYNGDIYPCIGAPIKAGSVLDSDFVEVWNESPVFNEIRQITNESFKDCVKCDLAQFCNRSSGSTYVNTKNYYGCDPVSKSFASIRKIHMSEISS